MANSIFKLLIALEIVILGSGIPLGLKLIPKNRWYGVRSARTLSGTNSDWYAVNQRAGVAMTFVALTGLLATALLRLAGGLEPRKAIAILVLLPVALLIALLGAVRGRI